MRSWFKVLGTLASLIWAAAADADQHHVRKQYGLPNAQNAMTEISYVGVEKAQSIADGSLHLESDVVNLFLPHAYRGQAIDLWDSRGVTIVADNTAPGLSCAEAAMTAVAGLALTQAIATPQSAKRGLPFVITLRPNLDPSDVTLAADGTLRIKRHAVQACRIQVPVLSLEN